MKATGGTGGKTGGGGKKGGPLTVQDILVDPLTTLASEFWVTGLKVQNFENIFMLA